MDRKLATRQRGHLVKEHRGGEYAIADFLSVHRATVYRVPGRSQDMNVEVR
ncbi:hypothetical protein GCM10009733_057790 [Nonomuraea maheshkhaliensis]|uniref:Resolvase HTH domain-containing protein n=1 Tax=Nonomuraea maheshkhaliensis TaxID=419590 RepID=A0ABP4RHG5_9ACTN